MIQNSFEILAYAIATTSQVILVRARLENNKQHASKPIHVDETRCKTEKSSQPFFLHSFTCTPVTCSDYLRRTNQLLIYLDILGLDRNNDCYAQRLSHELFRLTDRLD